MKISRKSMFASLAISLLGLFLSGKNQAEANVPLPTTQSSGQTSGQAYCACIGTTNTGRTAYYLFPATGPDCTSWQRVFNNPNPMDPEQWVNIDSCAYRVR